MGKQNATDDDDDDDMRGKGNGDDDNDDDDDDDWCKNLKWVFLPPTGGSGFSYENTQGINRTLPYGVKAYALWLKACCLPHSRLAAGELENIILS